MEEIEKSDQVTQEPTETNENEPENQSDDLTLAGGVSAAEEELAEAEAGKRFFIIKTLKIL